MDTLYTLMPLFLLILIMYFLLIRPQKRKEKQINAMRSSIKVGDDVITIGGLYGKVTRVKDESLTIQVGSDKTKLEVTRWAISKIVDEGAPASRPARQKRADEAKEDEPAKKAPRRRLDKAESPEVPEVAKNEPNPLETDENNTPLEQ